MIAEDTLKQIVEAALLAADEPLTVDQFAKLFKPSEIDSAEIREQIRTALKTLASEAEGRGYELKRVASGFRYQVRQELSEWVSRLWEEKPPRYSRALLETLALVAYKQPVTRGDIEQIRGVSVSQNIMRTMLERGWIRVVGQREVPGHPAMYGLPFTLSPGKTIILSEGDHEAHIGKFECRLSGGESKYILKVYGLPDREMAVSFLQELGGGLLWARISTQTGIHFDLSLDKVTYFKEPKVAARNIFGPDTKRIVDCIIDGGRTALFPSDKQTATLTGYPPTISQGIRPDRFISALAEVIEFSRFSSKALWLVQTSHFPTIKFEEVDGFRHVSIGLTPWFACFQNFPCC